MFKKPLQVLSGSHFRKNVAAVILDENNFILLAKRKKAKNHWQFPQGGVDEGESFIQALMREMKEELGSDQFEILKQSKQIFRYSWRINLKEKRGLLGQEQTYFLLRFLGQKKNLKPDKREFDTIEWVPYDQVLQKCAKIRRTFYSKILKEFESIIKVKQCSPTGKIILKPEKKVYSRESIKSLTEFLKAK